MAEFKKKTYDEMWEELERKDTTGIYKRARLMAKFLNNVQKLIREDEKSQEAIARGFGITPQRFYAVLNGQRPFNIRWVEPLCEQLGCDPNTLFAWEEKSDR